MADSSPIAGPTGPTHGPTPRTATEDDGCVVLDVARDRFLKLNPVGAAIWRRLQAGQSEAQIAHELAREYQVEEQRVAGDIQALRHRLAAMGITPDTVPTPPPASSAPSASPTAPSTVPYYAQGYAHARSTGNSTNNAGSDTTRPTPPWPMVLKALVGLAAFDLVLAVRSLKGLAATIQRVPVKSRKGPSGSDTPDASPDASAVAGEVAQVCAAVEKACVWYPKQAVCLQRSTVTTWLMRRHGVPARLVIGVRPMPFLAHAWVEVNGTVVNDWPRVSQFYPSLASY